MVPQLAARAEQVGQVGDDGGGAGLPQPPAVLAAEAVHPHDGAEPAGPGRLDPGQGLLDRKSVV